MPSEVGTGSELDMSDALGEVLENGAEPSGKTDDEVLGEILGNIPAEELEELEEEEIAPNEEAELEQDEDKDEELEELEEGELEQALEEEAPKEEPKRGAQARIRTLARERNELKQQLQTQQQQVQQWAYQQQQAAQSQMHELQRQNEIMQRQLELLTKKETAQEEATLSPLERLKREAAQQALQSLSPEIKVLKEQLEQERQFRAQAQQAAQSKARLDKYDREVKAATRQAFPEYADAPVAEVEALEQSILAYVAATGKPVAQAAGDFRKLQEGYYKRKLKQRTVTSGNKVKKTQATVRAPVGTKKGAKGTPRPSMSALIAGGYDDYISWRNDGMPALREPGQ